MTGTLVKKLLRDVRTGLIIVAALLFLFQLLWAKVTHSVSGQLLPKMQEILAEARADLPVEKFIRLFFSGPGQIVQKLIGADRINLMYTFDLLSSGYVHPLVQTILCIWAIGRASGAIAGEIDRGTMELLLAQPITRTRLIFAHLLVDLITIPILCLSMWGGTFLGAWMMGMMDNPEPLLRANPWCFGPSLLNVAALVFAVSGLTMWLSAAGRFRGRVLGLAVLLALLMFLVNVIGQLWDAADPLRPLTVFYYYQPQPIILNSGWYADGEVWMRLAVLLGVGLAGYGAAWWTFCRRDLPAPL